MEKMVALRSVYRSAWSRSYRVSAVNKQLLRHYSAARSVFNFSSPPTSSSSSRDALASSDCRSPLSMSFGSRRFYSEDVTHTPVIKDPELERAFKDLLAASWDTLPDSLINEVKSALKKSNDEAGKEVVTNVFRAAEAVEEFGDILLNLKMEFDDTIGMSGENVKPLSDEHANALRTAFSRYSAYLDAFGPDEAFLRKKVETELGAKLIFLKMRCRGLGAEWGKITILGTSGLAGSYVEQRA